MKLTIVFIGGYDPKTESHSYQVQGGAYGIIWAKVGTNRAYRYIVGDIIDSDDPNIIEKDLEF